MPSGSPAYSEHDAWATTLDLAEATRAALRNGDAVAAFNQVKRVEQIANAMIEQLARGVHKNPPLLVLGNPPRKRRGGSHVTDQWIDYVGPLGLIDSFKYRHETRGLREHEFELKDTHIWCVTTGYGERRAFLIENDHGAPVWDDIPNT